MGRELFRIIVLNVSMLVSLILLVFSFKDADQPLTAWQWAFALVCVGITAVVTTFDLLEWRRRGWKDLRGAGEIRDYMFDWIDSASSAAIFSRDMSWVQDDRMKGMLREKARSSSLVLVLPREIPFSAELKQLGASVYHYPQIDYVIRSRFTVVDLDSHNTRVAIGRSNGDRHRVEEISAGDNPSLNLAIDMLELVRRFVRQNEGA